MATKKLVALYENRKKELQSGDISNLVEFWFGTTIQNLPTTPKVWVQNGAVAGGGGVCTLFPTTTGLVGGTALFSSIAGIFALAFNNTASVIAAPLVSGKLISADRKTLTLNVVTGTGVLLGGNTTAQAPNGTVVYVLIVGS